MLERQGALVRQLSPDSLIVANERTRYGHRRTGAAGSHTSMILPIQDRLRAHVARLVASLYSLDQAVLPSLALEYPPNRELGDLGTPVAFELARRLRKAPRAIAQEIASGFGSLAGVRQVAAAPNGYLNFFLERPAFLLDRLGPEPPAELSAAIDRTVAGKAIVEHT